MRSQFGHEPKYPGRMRRNTILALILLLIAIMIAGALGVLRFWNLT